MNRKGLPADGHLALLHHLQKRALNLGRGAVDLIGQQQVCKHRSQGCAEGTGLLVVDTGTHQVCGYQIRGKLDPLERAPDGQGQGLHGHGLGQTRHPFDQKMAVGQHGHQHPLEKMVLPHDYLLDLIEDLLHE